MPFLQNYGIAVIKKRSLFRKNLKLAVKEVIFILYNYSIENIKEKICLKILQTNCRMH